MKNRGILLIAFLIFAGHYNLQQLSRTTALLKHFDHHQQQHKSTFSDFWFEHYTGSDTDQDDEDSDSSLPFKGYTPVPAFFAFVSETVQHIKPAPMMVFSFPEPRIDVLQPAMDTPWEPPC